jgi:2-polyprenyl-3-methyl-5-hydroxy-6-metoxy-1,4-benzoquinol methylase
MALQHFSEQEKHTRDYLLPYFHEHIPDLPHCKVLEIGCAEGGFLKPLSQLGMDARGIELSAARVAIALQHSPPLQVRAGDITDPQIFRQIGTKFDLIVMRDVLEHIPDRESTFKNLQALLKPSGYLYITFPPKYSAYGGHQQNAGSLVKLIPFIHLLPAGVLKKIGFWLKEKSQTLDQIIQIYHNSLSISEFEKLCGRYGFGFKIKGLFFSRPIFKIRHKLPVIRCPNLPLVREFLASGCEYLLQK